MGSGLSIDFTVLIVRVCDVIIGKRVGEKWPRWFSEPFEQWPPDRQVRRDPAESATEKEQGHPNRDGDWLLVEMRKPDSRFRKRAVVVPMSFDCHTHRAPIPDLLR